MLKHTSARTVHAKVIVKPARVLKFEFLAERFGEKLTGDPNAPAGVLGPAIPPLYSCQKLENSVKTGPLDDDSFGLIQIFTSIAVPPHLQANGGTPFSR